MKQMLQQTRDLRLFPMTKEEYKVFRKEAGHQRLLYATIRDKRTGQIDVILLGFGILQLGLSFKSHDPSQRANGMLTVVGGLIIVFTNEILNLITG